MLMRRDSQQMCEKAIQMAHAATEKESAARGFEVSIKVSGFSTQRNYKESMKQRIVSLK